MSKSCIQINYTIVGTSSDMDAEIRLLQENLVKAGMMSELLTGRIRLT